MTKPTPPSRQFKREFKKKPRRPVIRDTLAAALSQVMSSLPQHSENRTPTNPEPTRRYRLDRQSS